MVDVVTVYHSVILYFVIACVTLLGEWGGGGGGGGLAVHNFWLKQYVDPFHIHV